MTNRSKLCVRDNTWYDLEQVAIQNASIVQKLREMQGLTFMLRELIAPWKSRHVQVSWLIAVVTSVITGPFGTFAYLDLPGRTAYWTVVHLMSWALNIAVFQLINHSRVMQHNSLLLRSMVCTLICSLPIALFLTVLNQYIWPGVGGIPAFLTLWMYAGLFGLLISCLTIWIKSAPEIRRPTNDAATSEVKTKFFGKIPAHLGRDLISITPRDHYLEITTQLGSDLILMRFSDALNELQTEAGAQIHRSHWVADAAVAGFKKIRGRAFVVLKNGQKLPISNRFLSVPVQRNWQPMPIKFKDSKKSYSPTIAS
ncbi:MAG: LytTR family transcriptional regulator DNA-binding domain-containing protein [Cohaesibacteraceae bacterium]|nr:LytTR family transcriptional regulator DNA-binding domain-containing protein [Cohaesibacteraceae bacterium]MBL4875987.1 LytTR family transcriptional regulator DNA-binding domain-containing protein [Cohaesibacteraceae bacterium]